MAQKSEFASLSDIVLSQGIPHSEIISEIHDRVLVEYKRLYPDEIKTVEVLVNEKTGEVRLMRDKEDVTPASFISTAERVAREVRYRERESSGVCRNRNRSTKKRIGVR